MDFSSTAVLYFTVYQDESVVNRIFCLNAVLHNASQFQSLAKFDKFVFNSDFQFFTLLNFSFPDSVNTFQYIVQWR